MPLAGAACSRSWPGVRRRSASIDALDVLPDQPGGPRVLRRRRHVPLLGVHDLAARTCPKHERKRPTSGERRIDFGQAFHELKEGWSFIFINPVVRAVNVGLATGLIGGGMLVPLGPVFSDRGARRRHGRASASSSSRSGCGVAVGVVLLSVFQRHIPKAQVFAGVGVRRRRLADRRGVDVGARARGAVRRRPRRVRRVGYVLGFTLLHESVDDELRGRIFCALYTLVRFCVLLAFAVGPVPGRRSSTASARTCSASEISVARRRRSPCPACASRCGSPGSSSSAPACWPPCRCGPASGRRRRAAHRQRRSTSCCSRRAPSSCRASPDPFTEVAAEPRARRSRPPAADAGARPGRTRRDGDRPLHRLRGRGGERQVHPGPPARRAPRGRGAAHLRARRLAARRRGPSPRCSTRLDLEITDRAEALLMAADRAQHVAEVIQPALDAGRTVVTDRFAGSSVAYQGHGRQLPAAEVEQLSRWATDGLWPDLVVLLEVTAVGRRAAPRRRQGPARVRRATASTAACTTASSSRPSRTPTAGRSSTAPRHEDDGRRRTSGTIV